MKVLLVSEDLGPSKALARVALALVEQGHSVSVDFRENVTWALDIRKLKPDIVVSGMSSSKELAEGEWYALGEAWNWEISTALFADTFGTWGREWFKDYRDAELLFVINEEEKEKAKELFPTSNIVVSGNPTWEEFFSPRFSRKEIREEWGVSNESVVFICPAGKDLEVNKLFFWTVAEAIKAVFGGNGVLVACYHPGDKNPKNEYEAIFSEVGVEWFPSKAKTDDVLAGCDGVIASASTVGVTACCQRKLVINFFSEKALDRIEGQTGSRKYPPVEMGIELAAYNQFQLELTLSKMFPSVDEYRMEEVERISRWKELIEMQEKIFPRPKEGSAALIAKTLSEFVAKKKER